MLSIKVRTETSGLFYLHTTMKRLLVLIFLFAIGRNIAAQELTPVFGAIIPVTPTNTNGSTRPRIVLTNDSVPLVMWTRTGSGNGVVFTSRWNGSSFDPAVQVSPAGLNVYCSADEGGDIAAKGDTAYVVFFTTNSLCYCVHSYDAGLTWSDTVRIDHQGMEDAYTPDVQIDNSGNPVIVFETMDMMNMTSTIKVNRSFDGGSTFTQETDAHLGVTSGLPCECCPPSLLIKDSMEYVIYRNNDNNIRNIVMTISSDSGSTFPIVSEFDQTNWALSACPTAGAGADFYRDSILVVWKSANKIWYACADAQTGDEGADLLLEPALAAAVQQKQPSVCTKGDTVIYTWSDRRTTNYDVYISISGDGPRQITSPFFFNDTTATTENGTQQNPHAVAEGNSVHLVYQDLVSGKVIYRKASITGPVAVQETYPAIEFAVVYPVPADDQVLVSFSSFSGLAYSIRIWDVNGRLVRQQEADFPVTHINVADLPAGTYSVEVMGSDYSSVTTIIKK